MSPTRRSLLRAAAATAALAAVPGRAGAIGPASKLDVAEVMLPSGTISRPAAWTRLLFELVQTTSITTHARVVQVEPEDAALFQHPFAILAASAALPPLGARAAEQLGRYLSYGGFLVVEDTTGGADAAVDASIRAMAERLFPTRPLVVLGAAHSVYRSFFLIDRPAGRLARRRVLEGVAQGSMHPLIYAPDDLGGALDRDDAGRDLYACVPGGESQRREAIKLAINLVLYSLTSNYKQDQVHVRALLERGRLP